MKEPEFINERFQSTPKNAVPTITKANGGGGFRGAILKSSGWFRDRSHVSRDIQGFGKGRDIEEVIKRDICPVRLYVGCFDS